MANLQPLPPPLPPLRPGLEQRHDPRVDVLAAVGVLTSDHVFVLTVRNLSLGGAFLVASQEEVRHFPLGSLYELMIFDPEDESVPAVRVVGEVVRHQPGGLAVRWARHREAVRVILERLQRA